MSGGRTRSGRFALRADRVFDGEAFHADAAVVVEDGRVVDLVAGAAADPGSLAGATLLPPKTLLAPGFIDLQVNGGGGVMLNDAPTVETVARIAAAHRRCGTTGLLPTLITDTRETVRAAIAAVASAIATGVPGVLGIHLEGPFLNPARRGIHPERHMVEPRPGDVDLLSSLGDRGVTLVTLAPERVPPGFVAALTERGVRVCAGHTDADAQTITRAIDTEGLLGFTHLYNAMSPLASRAPGAVGVALADPRTFAGIIADGHHVADLALRLACRATGPERLMLVSDAMASVGSDATRFRVGGRTVTLEGGRITGDDGTLAGAHLDLAAAVRHVVRPEVGADLADALRMASRTPAIFLGLAERLGSIRPGFRADLVALDHGLNVVGTWSAGMPALRG